MRFIEKYNEELLCGKKHIKKVIVQRINNWCGFTSSTM